MNHLTRATLIKAYPDWDSGGGIFADLTVTGSVMPWTNDTTIASLLDLEFFGNIAGDRIISPLLKKLVDENTELSAENRAKIAKIITTMFLLNWEKEFATLNFEYNPIENYSMIEQMTNDITAMAYGRTDTRTDNLKQSVKESAYGFNSVEASDKDESSSENTGSQTNAQSGTDTSTRNYSLSRSGNIGVTTSQQMIESERQLYLWNFFESVVFPDLMRVLTIKIY